MSSVNDQFDKAIKDKLSDMSFLFEEAHWSSFEDALRTEGLIDAGRIQPKIGSSWSGAGASWEKMQGLLDQEWDDEFDNQVRDKVSNYQHFYDHTYWTRLENKLKERDQRDRRIFYMASRVAVAALLLLLSVFSLFEWNHNKESRDLADKYLSKVYRSSDSDNTFKEIRTTKEQDLNREGVAAKSTLESSNDDLYDLEVPALSVGEVSIDLGDLSTFEALPTSTVLNHSEAIEPLDQSVSNYLVENQEEQVLDLKTEDKPLIGHAIMPISSLGISSLKYNDDFDWARLKDHRGKLNTSLNVYSANDLVLINTDKVIGREAALATGVGASVSFRKGKVGLTMGAAFQELDYTDAATNSRTELSMVHVPIELTYSPKVSEKTDIYALAGVEGHFALLSEYSADPISRSDPRRVKDGLARQGGFNNNAYLTINAGIGASHELSKTVAVFGEFVQKTPFSNDVIASDDNVDLGFQMRVGLKMSLD